MARTPTGSGFDPGGGKDHKLLQAIVTRLDTTNSLLARLVASQPSINIVSKMLKQEAQIMATLDAVLADVSELPTINDSLDAVFAQIATLIAQLKAGGITPAQQAQIDQIDQLVNTQKDRTKAAIVANTPAA